MSVNIILSNIFIAHRSIRIPAALNGLYGLRPSYHRVPYTGSVNSMEGQDSLVSVLGPISNSLSGIKLFMQAISSYQPWLRDPLARRAPWDPEAYALSKHGRGKQLCFAVLWHDEQVMPHPPVTRALKMTKAALLAAGHQGWPFLTEIWSLLILSKLSIGSLINTPRS